MISWTLFCFNNYSTMKVVAFAVCCFLSSQEEDHVTSLAVRGDDGDDLVVGWRSLLIKQYNWRSGRCIRSWKVNQRQLHMVNHKCRKTFFTCPPFILLLRVTQVQLLPWRLTQHQHYWLQVRKFAVYVYNYVLLLVFSLVKVLIGEL